MTGNRNKIRSVFLTALMVFSVFAGTIAFAGTAAAAYPDVDGDPVEFTAPGGTNHIEVMFEDPTGSEAIPTADSAYTLEDRNGDPVTATVNTGLSNVSEGRIILDIGEDLNGEPELTIDDGSESDEFDVETTASTVEDPGNINGGTNPDATDGSVEVFKGERFAVMNLSGPSTDERFDIREGGEFGFLTRSTGEGSFIAVVNSENINQLAAGDTYYLTFRNSGSNTSLGVRDLGLSIEADDDEYDLIKDETVDIEVTAESNIAGRQVEFRLKEGGDYEDENVTATLGGDGTFTQEFTVDDDGNYSVEVADLRTDITDETGPISVSEVTGDASFTRGVYTEQRGDIARVTVNMQNRDEATVNIGGEDVGFLATVDLVDDDDDGQVTFGFNTYAPGQASAYFVEDDDDEITLNTSNGVATPGLLTKPLAPAAYTMNTTNGGVTERVEGSGFEEFDRASLNLRERSTDALNSWAAPAGSQGDFEDGAAVAEYIAAGNLTRDTTHANGDDVVLQLQASGLEGAINGTIAGPNATNGVEALDELESQGVINVTLYQAQRSKAPNADQVSFELSDMSSSEVIMDPKNNTVFLAFDSSDVVSQSADLEIDDLVVANVTLNDRDLAGDQALVPRNDRQTVTTQFRVVDDEVEFDVNDDDLVIVRAAEDQRITGTSTLAAGSEITVSAASTGASAFLLDNDTTIQPDGTFAAVLDFSNVTVGQNFTVDVVGTSLENDPEEDGRVVAAATASVSFQDQATDGEQVRVASASLSEGGFITIHDSTLQDGDALGSVRGTSSYLGPGSHTGIMVTLDDPVEGTETLIAMPHMDTNGNQAYDFVSSEGADDGPYTADGEAVTDSAEVSVETPTPTPTQTAEPTATATATPEGTATAEPTATEEPSTPEPTTTGDGAGFGVVVALIALIGAALLAVRRKD